VPTREEYDARVAGVRAALQSLPPGVAPRLRKSTSNLFRPRSGSAGPLDVDGFRGVLDVNPVAGTADILGMTTYEELVDATLPHGLMPLVVPQLKTITLGGAVTGLGIESSSWRNGLPHESVLDMDVLTGDGRVVTATPANEHSELFASFPNSYGTLGYALRLRIQCEPVRPFVHLRHVRFDSVSQCADAIAEVCSAGAWDGEPVHFVDGTWFSASECYLSLGSWSDDAPRGTSDYTGQDIYYRSIQRKHHDWLTVRDYLWRWDTDWFWCSRAFGAQNPRLRRIWPSRFRRSDVYWKLIALEDRFGMMRRIDTARGKPAQERVIQDIEVPVSRLAEFVAFLDERTGIEPVWFCPLRLRDPALSGVSDWPLYPLDPNQIYVNVGFWSAVPLPPGEVEGFHNRAIERKVAELGGRKSLYSTAFYDEAEFWATYGGETYSMVKKLYDPDSRLLDLYSKTVGRR
jgi:FAD/FMN-containing dehydrogenase